MKRVFLLSAIALAACGGTENTDTVEVKAEPAAVAAEVTLALTIADGIQASPAMADSILQANSLTRAGFDSLLYKIAADSTLSAQYAAGRK
jgi:hypothetical protein